MSAHKYELMFIADPELDERGLKKLTEQYLETVTKEGGAADANGDNKVDVKDAEVIINKILSGKAN